MFLKQPKAITAWERVWWGGAVALAMALMLFLLSPPPALAQNLAEYFQVSYNPVTFDKNEISDSNVVFYATITGSVTCTQTLPISISEASITSSVVARHAASGAEVVLNQGYTISVKPFPAKQGDTARINQSVPLQFPPQAQPGEYSIIGRIAQARVKVSFAWIDISGYLPAEQQMGTVKYGVTVIPENPPSPNPEPSPLPPVASTPSGNGGPPPAQETLPAPPPPQSSLPGWFWPVVSIAVVVIIISIILFLRRRAG